MTGGHILWSAPTFQVYYQQIDRIIADKLNTESPDYLLKVDFEQYLDYLVREAEWVPLEWDEGKITIESISTKVTRRDEWNREKTHTIDEQRFRLRVPTSGHPQLQDYLKFQPSTRWASGEPEWT